MKAEQGARSNQASGPGQTARGPDPVSAAWGGTAAWPRRIQVSLSEA